MTDKNWVKEKFLSNIRDFELGKDFKLAFIGKIGNSGKEIVKKGFSGKGMLSKEVL